MRPIDSLLIASRVTQSPADFEERSPWKSPPPLQIQILYSTPMLRTHRSPPGTMVQSRVSDMRVIQYWDKSHLVTKELPEYLPQSFAPATAKASFGIRTVL